MKKSMAVISAFIIGAGSFFSEMAVMAAQSEDCAVEPDGLFGNELDFGKGIHFLEESGIEYPGKSMDLFNVQGQESVVEDPDSQKEGEENQAEKNAGHEEKMIPENGEEETAAEDRAEIKDLQIPEKLEVVIDPWEMDGREQIYSEQYTIKNTGDTAGVLTLTQLSCRPQEGSGTIVRTDRNALHDNKEKSVYMEMLFENGEYVVLSEEGTEYKAELGPDEELTFRFTGEVNEYAEKGWEKSDITVGVVYSWDEKAAESQDDIESADSEKEIEDTKTEEDSEQESVEEDLPEIGEFIQGSGENEENQVKTADLQKFQKAEMVVDSWTIEEKDQGSQITSEEYVLKNTGQEAGILTLTDLTCRTGEQGGVYHSEEHSEESSVYVEMILGNGVNIVLSEESQDYQVELKPGEELTVRFTGEINESAAKNWEEGTVLVTAVCTWNQTADK